MFKIDALELSFLCKDFTSDAILGIARGGLTLSHFMSQALSQRNVFILNTISYDGRIQKDNVEVFNIPSLEKFRKVLIVDDIIDSGGTIINAVDALKKEGAKDVYVFITHAVLSGQAVEKIKKSQIKKLIITDTIENTSKIKNNSKIEVISIAPLMAEAINRISNSTSVPDLFN